MRTICPSISIFFLLFFLSCSTIQTKENYLKKHCLQISTASSDYEEYVKVCFPLPPFALRKKHFTSNNKLFLEYEFFFKDSSVFYVRNDTWTISHNNDQNLLEKGVTGYHKITSTDTIINKGVDSNGLYWNETILGTLTFGYANVSEEKSKQLEKSITNVVVSEK